MARNGNTDSNNDSAVSDVASTSSRNTTATAPSSTEHEQNADAFVDTLAAALPPSMEEKRIKTTDELLAEMNRIPLFMTTLDETDGAGGENVMLEAIKALAYEGTKAEVASNFREQGNEAARAKKWKDAREFYSKAVAAVQGKVKLVDAPDDVAVPETGALAGSSAPRVVDVTEGEAPQVEDEEAEKAKEREIEEACFANRALCNLEMKNYGLAIKDAASTLHLNPTNIKALYRAASACLALDKLPEALDACTKGLHHDPSNAPLSTLHAKILARQTSLASLALARQKREETAAREAAALQTALAARNILLLRQDKADDGTSSAPPDLEDAAIALSDPTDPTSPLIFPVLILYPLHAQSDLIKAFPETDGLLPHLDYLLPAPWDEGHEYARAADVECYVETLSAGLVRAGKKVALGRLLGSGKVGVRDGLVRVFVVPRARGEEWVAGWKVRRGRV